MKKFIFALLIAVFFISACSIRTTQKYESNLVSTIGAPEYRLVQFWGVPDKVYKIDENTKVIEYFRRREYHTGSSPSTIKATTIGNQTTYKVQPGSEDMVFNYSCRTTFVIQNGVVIKYSFEGNDCKAR